MIFYSPIETYAQRILGMDTSIVDVLAVFYCSGDRHAVYENYFGMVLLDGSSGLDKLLPTTECGYQYYQPDHKIVNKINDKINENYIANIRLGDEDDMAIFFGLLNREFTPGTWNNRPKVMGRDTTSLFYYLLLQLWNNQAEMDYKNREKCYSEPFLSWVSPYPKINYKRGYFYQLHKYRMAYLLIQDKNDSILRLAYYDPLHPVMFPKNDYHIITPSGEPITFTDEYAVHIRRYEKDGVSLVAVPYLFEYITTRKEKRKEKREDKRLKKSKSENYIIIP